MPPKQGSSQVTPLLSPHRPDNFPMPCPIFGSEHALDGAHCGIMSTLQACRNTVVFCCRWDAASSELICDELGVAYPVVNGIPNLRPADGRIIETGDKEISTNQEAWGNAESTQGSTGAPG